MCRGVGKWVHNLQLLDQRAGPSVRDDERQRIVMFGTNVNEKDRSLPNKSYGRAWDILESRENYQTFVSELR